MYCLKALFSNPSVREEVSVSHASSDFIMRDLYDGSFIKTHPLFESYPNALQFIIYFDDIEVCNPLGSSAGIHKLGNVEIID